MTVQEGKLITAAMTLVITLLSVGCKSPADVREGCVLPCWEDITPGVTSAEDAERIIREKKYHVEEISEDSEGSFLDWDAEDYHGNIIFRKDTIVSCITIWFDEERMTIGDIVGQLGAPETVEVEFPQQEDQVCGIRLQYEKRGVAVYPYSTPPDNFGVIEASQYVGALELCRAGSINSNPEAIIVGWRGYGVKHCDY